MCVLIEASLFCRRPFSGSISPAAQRRYAHLNALPGSAAWRTAFSAGKKLTHEPITRLLSAAYFAPFSAAEGCLELLGMHSARIQMGAQHRAIVRETLGFYLFSRFSSSPSSFAPLSSSSPSPSTSNTVRRMAGCIRRISFRPSRDAKEQKVEEAAVAGLPEPEEEDVEPPIPEPRPRPWSWGNRTW